MIEDVEQESRVGIVLDSKTHAPYTVFYEPATSASYEDIEDENYAVKLLDDILLPEKALAVEGLYPDDNDYPLFFVIKAVFPDLADTDSDADSNLNDDAQEDKDAIYRRECALQLTDSLSVAYEGADVVVPVSFIAFADDIMAGRGVDRTFEKVDGVKKVFGTVLPIIQNSDLSIGNLEGAITQH